MNNIPLSESSRLPRLAALAVTVAFATMALTVMAPSAAARPDPVCPGSLNYEYVLCTVENVTGGLGGTCQRVAGSIYVCVDTCAVRDGSTWVCVQGDCGTGVVVEASAGEDCVTVCNGPGVEVTLKGDEKACVSAGSVDLCSGGTYGVIVDGTPACVDTCPSGYGAVVNGVPECHTVSTGCDPGSYGVILDGVPYCSSDQVLGSCTGVDDGIVVAGIMACEHPCDSGSGVVLNGVPECHTVGLCTSNPYGVAIDGSGCHTLSSCPSGKYGYRVDGNSATCVGPVPPPPSVTPCPSPTYGVVVDGTPYCATVGVCSGGSYGVAVDGIGCVSYTTCGSGEVGVKLTVSGEVNNYGPCEDSPVVVENCPNGRTGVVVNGQEVCPIH